MAEVTSAAQVQAAVREADEWLAEHRVSESWRVINRLRDTLVRTTDDRPDLPGATVTQHPAEAQLLY